MSTDLKFVELTVDVLDFCFLILGVCPYNRHLKKNNCTHIYFPASEQAVVTGAIPSPPRFWPSIFVVHGVQRSYSSSNFHRVFLTHGLALSARKFVRKVNAHRIYTSMHFVGLELMKLTYIRLEDTLTRHRGDIIGLGPPLELACQGQQGDAYQPMHGNCEIYTF